MARLIAMAVLAPVLGLVAVARADMSGTVISAFRGQLVVSKNELPSGKDARETIKKIGAAAVKDLEGVRSGETVTWHFHYAAFLDKPGASTLKLEFVTTDDKHQLVADKHLEGADPKSDVIIGDITIDEDDGLSAGTTYSVELTSGDTELCKTVITFK
jgi:hypothetical protein